MNANRNILINFFYKNHFRKLSAELFSINLLYKFRRDFKEKILFTISVIINFLARDQVNINILMIKMTETSSGYNIELQMSALD